MVLARVLTEKIRCLLNRGWVNSCHGGIGRALVFARRLVGYV